MIRQHHVYVAVGKCAPDHIVACGYNGNTHTTAIVTIPCVGVGLFHRERLLSIVEHQFVGILAALGTQTCMVAQPLLIAFIVQAQVFLMPLLAFIDIHHKRLINHCTAHAE